jgi:hypothetical protein
MPTPGDASIEQINQLLLSGQIQLGDPSDPVVQLSPDGQPIKRSAANAMQGVGTMTSLQPKPAMVTPGGRELNAQQVADLATSTGMPANGSSFDADALISGIQNTPAGQSFGTQRAEADAIDNRYGHDMAWLDPLFQQDETAPINTARQLGTTADPETAAKQSAFSDNIAGRGTAADMSVDAAQKGLADQLLSRGTTADTHAQGVQQNAVDELLGLYKQGGLGAQERAARAKARADSENWLKGQREADQQDLATRGLSGSGSELATLSADRQGAASRLSAADLETSASAEKRALDALLGSSGLATTMRNQSDAFANEGSNQAARVLGDVRGAGDAYSTSNTNSLIGLLGDQRSAADRYTQTNADQIARIAQANKDYLRNAQQQTLNNRQQWDQNVLNQQVQTAHNQRGFDAAQNDTGWDTGYQTASVDAGARNNAQTQVNQNTLGAFTGYQGPIANAGQTRVSLTGGSQAAAGQSASGGAQFVGNLISSIYGGKGGGSQTNQGSQPVYNTNKGQ